MFDPRLYREACGELRAPQEKIEEIIAMTENHKSRKNRRPVRAVLAAAAAVAAMAIGVSAATRRCWRASPCTSPPSFR